MDIELVVGIAALAFLAGGLPFVCYMGRAKLSWPPPAPHKPAVQFERSLDMARADAGLLRRLLRELADDYEAEISARYGDCKDHPSIMPRFQDEMAIVDRARAAVRAQPWEMVDMGQGVDGIVSVEKRDANGKPSLWVETLRSFAMAKKAKDAAYEQGLRDAGPRGREVW